MRPTRSATSVRWLLATAVLVWLATTGCATTGSEPTQEQRLRLAKSHFDIGLDHLDNGRFAVGLRELRTAAQYDPKNPRIQVALAEAYVHQGKAEDAEAHLLRALEIYPEYHDARLSLSGLYLLTGRWSEAAVHSEKLIDDPTFPGVWRAFTNLGGAQRAMKNPSEARLNLERALEFNDRYWPALLSLGILEAEQGNKQKAIATLERMLEQNPSPNARAEANYHLAELHVSLGDRQKAVGHLMAAVTQAPEGEWGRKSEEYLKILR